MSVQVRNMEILDDILIPQVVQTIWTTLTGGEDQTRKIGDVVYGRLEGRQEGRLIVH